MKKSEDFDCVKMKHDIQRRIDEECKGMSRAEMWKYLEAKVLANPRLARFAKLPDVLKKRENAGKL